jgi:hypothetical protein
MLSFDMSLRAYGCGVLAKRENGGLPMSLLGPIPVRMLLCVSSALALTSLTSATPTAAQQMKASLNQPVTEKDIEAVRQHLDQRIGELVPLEAQCQARHERIEEAKEDALDAIDSLADNRRSGRVARGEVRASKKIAESAEQAHASAKRCVAAVQAQIAETKAILSSRERLLAEVPKWRAEQFQLKQVAIRERQLAEARREAAEKAAAEQQAAEERAAQQRREAAVRAEQERRAVDERLSKELREQWLTLLENARSAHEIFASSAPNEDLSLRLEAMGRQFQSIRLKYARQLQMGEHRALGMAVYAAYAALTAAGPDWQKERQAASDLGAMQATADRYTSIRRPSAMDRANADDSMRRLRGAQQEYEQVKVQLAAKRDSVARLISEAVRVAKGEREQTQQVSAEARNP